MPKRKDQTSIIEYKISSTSPLDKETKLHKDFITAFNLKDYKTADKILFTKIPTDEIAVLDKKYNLVELIYSSNVYHTRMIKAINEIVSSCNSAVGSSTLIFCVRNCNTRTVRSLLSYGSDPNGKCIYPLFDHIIDNIIHEPNIKYSYNLYLLIIYGLDLSRSIDYVDRDSTMSVWKRDYFEKNRDNGLPSILKYKMSRVTNKIDHKYLENMFKATKRGIEDMKNSIVNSCPYLILDLHNIILGFLFLI